MWQIAQQRWNKHFEAWRVLNLDSNAILAGLAPNAAMIRAQRKYVAELTDVLCDMAKPKTYHVRISQSVPLNAFERMEVSPTYPYTAKDFDVVHEAQTSPDSVKWKPITAQNHMFNLITVFGNVTNCVCYIRASLEAQSDCTIHLVLGSDDGLSIFANGERILARDVMRGCNLGDDQVDVKLKKGVNKLLFRVTQFGGGYALAVKADVAGLAKVRQV